MLACTSLFLRSSCERLNEIVAPVHRAVRSESFYMAYEKQKTNPRIQSTLKRGLKIRRVNKRTPKEASCPYLFVCFLSKSLITAYKL